MSKALGGKYFDQHIKEFLRSSVMPQSNILMVGCTDLAMLEALEPSHGVGLLQDSSEVPIVDGGDHIKVLDQGFKDYKSAEIFDYIIFNDYLTYEDDLYQVFLRMHDFIGPHTKIFIIGVNPRMFTALRIARSIGLHTPKIERNILKLADIENLAKLFGYEVLDRGHRFFVPFELLGLGRLLNSVLARMPGLRRLSFGHFTVVRPFPQRAEKEDLTCSVVVPCFNEEENVRECVERIPSFGRWREIVVVDDGSQDRTAEIVEEMARLRDDITLISYEKNRGKGYAMKEGWQNSKGEVLMMLDCDMTTPPEEMILFYEAMKMGAEFVNGTRIVYPREKKSIPGANRLGVAFFAWLISWLSQRRISDTFCGTKVFLRKYWQHFEIEEFLWGDWDLFFMAARFRVAMAEVPVHYKTRKAGEAKMRPIRHGLSLLRTSLKGLWIVK